MAKSLRFWGIFPTGNFFQRFPKYLKIFTIVAVVGMMLGGFGRPALFFSHSCLKEPNLEKHFGLKWARCLNYSRKQSLSRGVLIFFSPIENQNFQRHLFKIRSYFSCAIWHCHNSAPTYSGCPAFSKPVHI